MIERLRILAGRMQEQRELVLRTIKTLGGGELERKRPGDAYTAKEILAHLAGAERGMERLAELSVAGEASRLRPDYNNDVYNARQIERRREASVNQIEGELVESRRRLIALMESLREEDLGKWTDHPFGETDLWGLLNRIADHEAEHTAELVEWANLLARERKDA